MNWQSFINYCLVTEQKETAEWIFKRDVKFYCLMVFGQPKIIIVRKSDATKSSDKHQLPLARKGPVIIFQHLQYDNHILKKAFFKAFFCFGHQKNTFMFKMKVCVSV